jgi:hypothetical protein
VARQYPQLDTGQQPPFQLALLPAEKVEPGSEKEEQREVEIHLPVSVSGIAPESIVAVDGAMVDIEAPDGLHWNSGWMSRRLSLFPEQKSTRIDFSLKRNIFDHMSSSPVKVQVSLAFTLFHDANRREFVTPSGEFTMPDVGRCSTESSYSRGIHCLAPLREPKSLLMSADMSMSTCPVLEGESRANHGEIGRDWTRRGGSEPAEFGISPIKTVNLYLTNWNDSAKRWSAGICPGTPLVLSNPELVGRNRTALLIDSLRLSDYRLASLGFTIGNVAIGLSR